MSDNSLRIAGVILIVVPTVEFGGVSLLRFILGRAPGYMENPTRQALFRAGHAHAGVLVLLALIGLLYVDTADLSGTTKEIVRWCLFLPPILMPAGFFLSITPPQATRPNALIALVPVGAAFLGTGTVLLGIGLLRAA